MADQGSKGSKGPNQVAKPRAGGYPQDVAPGKGAVHTSTTGKPTKGTGKPAH